MKKILLNYVQPETTILQVHSELPLLNASDTDLTGDRDDYEKETW